MESKIGLHPPRQSGKHTWRFRRGVEQSGPGHAGLGLRRGRGVRERRRALVARSRVHSQSQRLRPRAHLQSIYPAAVDDEGEAAVRGDRRGSRQDDAFGPNTRRRRLRAEAAAEHLLVRRSSDAERMALRLGPQHRRGPEHGNQRCRRRWTTRIRRLPRRYAPRAPTGRCIRKFERFTYARVFNVLCGSITNFFATPVSNAL